MNNNFRKLAALITLFFYCTLGFADQTQTNTLILGKPTATDKTVIFNSTASNKANIKLNSSSNRLQFSNDGVNFKDIGSGGGSETNYYADYADGAALGTVDSVAAFTGTQSNPTRWRKTNNTISFAVDTTSKVYGTSSFAAQKSNGVTDFGVLSPLVTLSSIDANKPITVGFAYVNSGTVTPTVNVYRYNSSNVYQETITISGVSSSIISGTGIFQGFFIPSATATDKYAFGLTNANAGQIGTTYFDGIYFGSQSYLAAASMQDSTVYTPTITGTGGTFTATGLYSIIGNRGYYDVSINMTSAGSGTNTVTVSIPHTIDTAKLSGISSTVPFGVVNYYNGTTRTIGIVGYEGSSLVNMTLTGATTVLQGGSLANTSATRLTFSVPIVGYSSNQVVANRATEEYASNDGSAGTTANTAYDTGMVNGASGSQFVAVASTTGSAAVTKYRVRFQSVIQPTDTILVELYKDGLWRPIAANNEMAQEIININNSVYGMGITAISGSTTDVYVAFGNQGRLTQGAASYAASGTAWSGIAGDANQKWRVRKITGGSLVGYPLNSRNIVSDVSGTAIPAGVPGYVLTSTVASVTGVTSIVNLTSITLTVPGNYRVFGKANAISTGTSTRSNMSISTTSATEDSSSVVTSLSSTSGGFGMTTFRVGDVTVPQGSSVTVYLTGRSLDSTATFSNIALMAELK